MSWRTAISSTSASASKRWKRGCGAAVFAVTLSLAGCSPSQPESPVAPRFDGVEVSVRLPEGSPLDDAINLRLTEWQARTGAKGTIVRSGDADLCILAGNDLAGNAAQPIPAEILNSPSVAYEDFAPHYRQNFNLGGESTVRIPLTTDGVFLWYRTDLFDDPQARSDYQAKRGKELQPPRTWQDYLAVAEYFHGRAPVKYGCVEAMDESDDAVRNFFVHAAAYAKGPEWSSFAIDTETGTPLLTADPFRQALVDWIAARKSSPAGDPAMKEAISDDVARKLFRDGAAAMLLSRIPPTVDPGSKESIPTTKTTGVLSLPGSETVTNPKTNSGNTQEALNGCVHLASTGWFVMLGKPSPTPAALALLEFLNDSEETEFLVQASRRGVAPARTLLLSEPGKFQGYRLTAETTRRWFGLMRNSLAVENWVADLRINDAKELNDALAKHLQLALRGETTPEGALKAANEEWKLIIAKRPQAFLDEYRQSLGLPKLIP